MAKQSTEITGKIRSALFLLSALIEQGPVVTRLVSDKLRTSLKGAEEPLDFLTLIRGLGRILEAALDLMVELDNLLVDENQLRTTLYQAREDKIVFLGQRITGVRRLVTGHFVQPDLARLGLEGRTARESVALLRQSELICQRLIADDVGEMLGESLFEPALDFQTYEAQITPAVGVLREALEDYQRSRRRADEVLARRREAVKEYNTAFVRVARQFEDLCRLAGLDELADKVRPSLTRKGETAVPPDDGEVSATDASTDGGEDASPPAEEATPADLAASPPASGPVPATEPEPAPETAPDAAPGDQPGAEAAGESPAPD